MNSNEQLEKILSMILFKLDTEQLVSWMDANQLQSEVVISSGTFRQGMKIILGIKFAK